MAKPEGADVCGANYADGQETTTTDRQEMRCYSVQIKDHALLRQATSGGFVTGMIRELLHGGAYQAAFLPSGYDYREQMKSTIVRKGDDLEKTQRSRYFRGAFLLFGKCEKVYRLSCVHSILRHDGRYV